MRVSATAAFGTVDLIRHQSILGVLECNRDAAAFQQFVIKVFAEGSGIVVVDLVLRLDDYQTFQTELEQNFSHFLYLN
jgi:hypothetical protein